MLSLDLFINASYIGEKFKNMKVLFEISLLTHGVTLARSSTLHIFRSLRPWHSSHRYVSMPSSPT